MPQKRQLPTQSIYDICMVDTWIYGPSTKCMGHKFEWKKRGSVNYRTDRENEVSMMYISGSKDGEDFNQAEQPLMIATRQILNGRTIDWFP